VKTVFTKQTTQNPEAGQAMVEYALVAVFLFVLFISIIQMILLMYAYTTLADAAKEGIRYAIVHGTGNTNCSGPGTTGPPAVTCPDNTNYTNVKAAVTNFAGLSFQNITNSDVDVSYNPNSANGASPCNVAGCMVQVTVHHTYTPFFGLSWPNVTIYAAAQGRIMN
jgi:Flp pilus assembly pilin Flp